MAGYAGASAITGILGALMDYGQGMEDREFWKGQTKEAGQRIDDATRMLFEGDPEAGYKGILDIVGEYTPKYGALSDTLTRDANAVARDVNYGYGALNKQYDAGASGLQGKYDALSKSVQDAYGTRTNRAMGMLEGLGDEERARVAERYNNARSQTNQDLTNRGMGNTSLVSSNLAGLRDMEDRAQRELGSDLRREQLSTYGEFSGDELGTRKEMGVGGVELGNNLMQNRIALGEAGVQAGADAGRWAAETGYQSGFDALAQSERLTKEPLDLVQAQLDRRVGSMQGFGLPPQVVSPFSAVSSTFAGLDATQAQKKAASAQNRGGSVSLFGSGFSW